MNKFKRYMSCHLPSNNAMNVTFLNKYNLNDFSVVIRDLHSILKCERKQTASPKNANNGFTTSRRIRYY